MFNRMYGWGRYSYLHWRDLVRSDVDWSIAVHICYKFSCNVFLMGGKYHYVAIGILCQNCITRGNSLLNVQNTMNV